MPTKGGPSGKVTLDQKPVPKKNRKKSTAKISWPTKRGRRSQEQCLVSSTRPWTTLAFWCPPFLSCKSKYTKSNGCLNRRHGMRPRSGKC